MKTEKNYVKIDSRNRVTLPKSVTQELSNLYTVYRKGSAIILEPVIDVPEEERWILDPKNKDIVQKIKKALQQEANIRINLDDYDDPSSSSVEASDSVKTTSDRLPIPTSGSRK